MKAHQMKKQLTCESCGKQFPLDEKVFFTEPITHLNNKLLPLNKPLWVTYLKCPHCEKYYLTHLDDQISLNLNSSLTQITKEILKSRAYKTSPTREMTQQFEHISKSLGERRTTLMKSYNHQEIVIANHRKEKLNFNI